MKRTTQVRGGLAIVLLFLAAPSFGTNGNISIYTDINRWQYDADLEFQVPLKLYVFAEGARDALGAITGAEYQISRSFETDWLFAEDFSPATDTGAITVGGGALNGPLPGINIAWGTCQTEYAVLLQNIVVFDFTGTFANQRVTLTVVAHSTPGNPFFRCPLLTLCDDPAFTKVCLGQNTDVDVCPFPPGAIACLTSTSGQFILNKNAVPVDSKTWSETKSLYRN